MAGIILGLMGGLGMFLYGMKLMSDGLEKAAGAKMRSICEFYKNSIKRNHCRNILYGSDSVFKCVYRNGSQLCKFRSDELISGGRRDHGRQYRYDGYFAADFFKSVCACAGYCNGRRGYGHVLQ